MASSGEQRVYWVLTLLSSFPVTRDVHAWYAGSGFFALGTVLLIGAVGCRTAIDQEETSCS